MVKKLLALFLVVLMSIESFGAVVSDNDGSAFITKAEFDSLKNNFQSQIDQYNTSIDSKIDGAIASYLAGINVGKSVTNNIIFSSWDKGVYLLNGALTNEFRSPAMDFSYATFIKYEASSRYFKNWAAWLHGIKTEDTTSHNYRNLVTNVTENPLETIDMIWDGRANNWSEKQVAVKMTECATWDPGGASTTTSSLSLRNFLDLNLNGYVGDLSDKDCWIPQIWWANTFGSTTQKTPSAWPVNQVTVSLQLLPYDGDLKSYEHVLNWKIVEWELWNNNFLNTFGIGQNQANTASSLFGEMTKSGHVNGCETDRNQNAGVNPTVWIMQQNTPTYETRTTYHTTAGIVGLYDSDKIHQFKPQKVELNNKQYDLDLNLVNGFALCAANENDRITWEPVFSNVKTSDSRITTNGKINIMLAYEPFGDAGAVSPSKIIKTKAMEDGTITNNWTTTPDGSLTTKLEWTMNEDGIVYVIWWPTCTDDDAKENSSWEIMLDIDKCKTYTLTKS